MANLWKNNRQFKIIEMSWKEYVGITGTWSLCDCCNEAISEENGYYVALLNSWYCKNCLEAYLKGVERRSSEDLKKEQLNFINIRNKLIDLGVWND